jgi:HK97 family phage major capsid protein
MSEFDPKMLAKAVEDVNKGFEEFKSANDMRLKEIESKGSADPLLDQKLEKINAAIEEKQARLDQFELSMKRQSRVIVDEKGNEIDMDAKAAQWANMVARARGTRVEEFGAKDLTAYKSAFNVFLRKGDEIIGADEKKALSVGTDPDGGYVVHPDMSGAIIGKVFETSPMRAYASIQVISTDALEGLYDLEEASSGWVGETDARSETGTPQLGKWRIPVHELYAKPKATQKILDDAEVNMESWLAMKVSDKFARDESAAFVNGSGVNKPRGFLTYADGSTLPGTIERFNTGANGGFAADPNGGDVLIDALYGLKAQYRANATWFMNRATTKAARKLKDSYGNYLWAPGIAAGQPASLMGYPIAAFEDMPNPATGSLSIAVGDMRAAYQIVDRVGIRTLRDPYSAKPYVEFYTTKRVGGDVVNFEALKLVEFSAS